MRANGRVFFCLMREIAKEIVLKLRDAGYESFFVGGCVRDGLLGIEPNDYDIATDALPNEIERLFPQTFGIGKQFGVMMVLQDGEEFQVATFRAESGYADARRPDDVTFCDARTDAERRDFTVNGLFLDPLTDVLYDWVGGQADMKARLLRTIGNPEERFREDHLRLLRTVRFAAQLEFEIDESTFVAVKHLSENIKTVSAERIRDELIKLFRPPYAARGLDLLRASGLMTHVMPELSLTIDCEQSPDYHPEGNVYNHIRLALESLPNDASSMLPWTLLLHDIGKPVTSSTGADGRIHFYGHEKVGADITEAILERLRFPRKQIDEIVFTVRHHMQFKDAPKMRKATLRRMLLRPTFELELEQHRLDCLASHGQLDILDFLKKEKVALDEQPELIPPIVCGNDLMEIGVKPGPAMGDLLETIRDKQLAEEFTTREQVVAWVKEKTAQ